MRKTSSQKPTGHMLVKNEERWIWYAITSVLDELDKLLIFDTGSTDNTKEIIKKIQSQKIEFSEKGNVPREQITQLRNQMIEKTKTDWFMLIDGDEIWPKTALKEVISQAQKADQKTLGIVVRTRNCVGDIWHYQPESAGKYNLLGKTGHLTIRMYKKQNGFLWKGVYPNEAYCNQKGEPINDQKDHLVFVDVAYWHTTHLKRTSKPKDVIDRLAKFKLEKGIRSKGNELPEVFFIDRPKDIPSPWSRPNVFENLTSQLITPLRHIKRAIKK